MIQSEKLSAIGELATKLAHEVLNPLAGMKAAVQLLARTHPHDPDRARETARALSAEIARVEALMGRLLNFARPLTPRVQVTAVGALLDAAVAATRQTFAQNQVVLARSEPNPLPPLEVDPLLVTQAIANLLANAAQTMPSGGVVELAATRRLVLGREEVAIAVADHGPGIAAGDERMLFHPFFHHQAQRPRAGPGDQPEHRRRARRAYRGRRPPGGGGFRRGVGAAAPPMVR